MHLSLSKFLLQSVLQPKPNCYTCQAIINMNRQRGRRQRGGAGSRGRPVNHPRNNRPAGEEMSSTDDAFVSKDGMSRGRGRSHETPLPLGNDHVPKRSSEGSRECFEEENGIDMSGSGSKRSEVVEGLNLESESDYKLFPTRSETIPFQSDRETYPGRQVGKNGVSDSVMPRLGPQQVWVQKLVKETLKPLKCEASDQNSQSNVSNCVARNRELGSHDLSPIIEPFDICLRTKGGVNLNRPLFLKNREKRNELKNATGPLNGKVLRPGMVFLQNYLSIAEQVKIVEMCRNLGLGSGGFYQPAYSNGARLRLKMMCLGRNWDPESGKYGPRRPYDDAYPPILPREFLQLVEKAIEDSHVLIQRDRNGSSGEDILPRMTPNICIVNFYSTSGKLGLHKDKDESPESLRKGLPVVSFSIGDTGEFLYSDEREVDTAEKVLLNSGDVLIFGGKSRHIFHGVSSIQQSTAPKCLLEKTRLRPGRLNLTFREY